MHILQVSGLARLVQFDPSRDRLVTFSSMVISTEWAPTPGEVLPRHPLLPQRCPPRRPHHSHLHRHQTPRVCRTTREAGHTIGYLSGIWKSEK